MRYALTAALFVSLLIPATASADLHSQLRANKIMSVAVPVKSGVKPGRSMGLVDAPPEAVYRVLYNFASYKEFMPRVTGSYRSGKDAYVIKCKLPWPIKEIWADIKVKRGKQKGMYVITWKMNKGNIKAYEGMAWIQPYGKNKTLLTYQMSIVPNAPVPGALLTNGLKDATWEIVFETRKRVAQVLAGKVAASSRFKVARQ